MKNFKQVLALVVVFMMMLSTVAMAAIPADVVGTDYEGAAIRLGALGIMIGDEGGFRPEDSVKRSEMAKITVIMVGSDAAAKAAAGNTVFSDVAADHWASGYINVATSLGLVVGMGDGTFAPDAEVTNAQAVTMIMRALNYESFANDNGGYPTGYLVAASNADVLEGLDDLELDKAATRGIIALLVDNALEAPMMVQTTYGNGSKEYVISGMNGRTEETILVDKLKLKKFSGTVEKIDTEKGRITLKGVALDPDTTVSSGTVPNEIKYNADLTIGAELKEMEINFWVDKNNVMICYAMPEETEIVYGYIESVNGYSSSQMQSKKYALVEDKDNNIVAIESIELSTGISYTINKDEEPALFVFDDEAEPKFAADFDLPAKTELNAYVKMPIKATVQDGKLTKIGFFDYSKVGIVSEVSDSMLRATEDGLKASNKGLNWTKLDDAESILVIKDGVVGASLADIEAGMYVMGTTWQDVDAEENSYIILVSSNAITGRLAKITSTTLTVGEESLRLAETTIPVSIDGGNSFREEDLQGANLVSLLQGEVTAITNFVGDVVAIIGTSTASRTVYGFIDRVTQVSGDDTIAMFVIENDDVAKKTYYVATTGAQPTASSLAAAEDYSRKAIERDSSLDEAAKLKEFAEKGYFKATLNSSNEIKSLEQLTGTYTIGGEKTDALDTTDKVVYSVLSTAVIYAEDVEGAVETTANQVDSSTKFFDISGCFDDAGAPTLVDYTAFIGKDLTKDFKLSIITDNSKMIAGVLTNGTSGTSSEDVKFGLVTESATTGEGIVAVTMLTADGTVEKLVDTERLKDGVAASHIRFGSILAYEEIGEDEIRIFGTTKDDKDQIAGEEGAKVDFKEVTVTVTEEMVEELEYGWLLVNGTEYVAASDAMVYTLNKNDKYEDTEIGEIEAGDELVVIINNYDELYVTVLIK